MSVAEDLTGVATSAEAGEADLVDFSVSGTFVATWALEADIGGVWSPVASGVDAPGSGVGIRSARPTKWRVNCSAYTSGTLTVRISE